MEKTHNQLRPSLWALRFAIFVFLGLISRNGLALGAADTLPDIGQPYGWWYTTMPEGMQRGNRGGDGRSERSGGDERRDEESGDRSDGRGGDHSHGSGGGRRSGGFGGGGRGMRLPVKIRLGVSGVGSPAMAPEVFYRLTPRDPDDGPPKVYKATIDKVEGTWQVELAPPVGGVAEVFSRYDLGGTLVYSQINCQAAPAHEGSRTDPMGTLPEDWPRLVFPDGPDGMPFWGLMVGQKTDFVLAGPSSEPGKALVAEENGYGPPEPLVSESATGKYSYTATEEEGGQATEARRGGRLAVVTVTPKSGELVTFSLTISRPRTGRNQVPQGLALTGGSAAIAAFGCFAYRRRFKYGDYNKASNKSKGSSKP